MKQTWPIDGRKLRTLRAQRVMTASEVVHHTGLSQSRLTELEAGGKHVHASTLKRLAEALGVQPSELLEEESEGLLAGTG